jgi:hypothetical protein
MSFIRYFISSPGTKMDDQEGTTERSLPRKDGHPVRSEVHLALSWMQLLIAFIITLAAVVGGFGSGINDGFDFGCKQSWWAHGCPKTDKP